MNRFVAAIDVDQKPETTDETKTTDESKAPDETKMETDSDVKAAPAEGGDVFKVMDSVGEVDPVIPVVDNGTSLNADRPASYFRVRLILWLNNVKILCHQRIGRRGSVPARGRGAGVRTGDIARDRPGDDHDRHDDARALAIGIGARDRRNVTDSARGHVIVTAETEVVRGGCCCM